MNQQLKSAGKPSGVQEPGETLELGRLSGSLGFLLRMAQIKIFDAYHAELGEYGLKPGEFSVIWLIGQYPGVRQGMVARSLRIKLAHMTKLVRSLEDRGFLERVIPDDDRRSVLLHQTEKGREFVARHDAEFFGYFFSQGNKLTPEEAEQLVQLLQKYTGFQDGANDEL